MSTIAIVGAGKLGTAIARLALRAGHAVRVVGSGAPEETALITKFTAPGSTAHDLASAVRGADLVVAAIPLPRFRALEAGTLAGATVIDAMNHWAPTDGEVPGISDTGGTSSEALAGRLEDSIVVKSLNHIGYQDLEREARAVDRVAVGVAGDEAPAVAAVAEFVDSLGFEAVPLGGLAAGRALQPGAPLFGRALAREELVAQLHDAGLREPAPRP